MIRYTKDLIKYFNIFIFKFHRLLQVLINEDHLHDKVEVDDNGVATLADTQLTVGNKHEPKHTG